MDLIPVNTDHGQRRLLTALLPPVAAVVMLWIVFAFDQVYGLDLYRFGIFPRKLAGLVGVLASPLIHANIDHLANNSVPVLVLGWLLVYFYPKAAWRVVSVSWIMSSFWVWVAGRPNYHIGASGVIYGLAAFLFFSGLIRRRVALMAVSLIVVFQYGSMWWGVLPLVPHVSWEAHLFGGITGAILAWHYRKVPPAHVPPPIVLEDEPEEPSVPAQPPYTIVYEVRGSSEEGDEQPAKPATPPHPGYDPQRTSGTFPWE